MSDAKISSKLFFQHLVFFLEDLFVIEDVSQLEKFRKAVEYYCYFTFQMDNLIDGDLPISENSKSTDNPYFKTVKAHQVSIEILNELFSKTDDFWRSLDVCSIQYFDGLAKEQLDSQSKPVYNLNDFETYSFAKHSLAKIPLVGMKKLFEFRLEEDSIVDDLLHSIFKGMQMNDDLEDFSKDEINHQWTYAHSRVRDFITMENLEINPTLSKFSERVLYVSGIGLELNTYAKDQFVNAMKLAKQARMQRILPWIQENLRKIESNELLIKQLTAD